jgi:prepilin-type processing-associated H-X9-DG protein
VVNTPVGVTSAWVNGVNTFYTPYLWSNRNWTIWSNQPVGSWGTIPRQCSYGYDPRIYPAAVSGLAIFGDWDGSWQNNHDTSTQNHDGGQNVLYVDGSVKWQGGNYVSTDPIDNIYMEGGDQRRKRRTDLLERRHGCLSGQLQHVIRLQHGNLQLGSFL